MELVTKDLQRIMYNALLYADKKSDARGCTYWWTEKGYLNTLTSDDFVVLHDRVPVSFQDTVSFSLSNGDLKQEFNNIKDLHEERIDWTSWNSEDYPPEQAVLEDYWTTLVSARSLAGRIPSEPPVDFAFWPDRLRKLSLVKPQGQPCELGWVEVNGRDEVLRFRFGSDTVGLLAPLDMTKLEAVES